jgi:DNA-binding HxlR family transcriptional regulator
MAAAVQREGIDAGRGPMKWNALAGQSSSLCKALSVIGDRWTLLILNQCFLKLRRYGEIQSSLGLSRPLLAARLKKMVRLGVLKKVPSRESARVHDYPLPFMTTNASSTLANAGFRLAGSLKSPTTSSTFGRASPPSRGCAPGRGCGEPSFRYRPIAID